MKKKLFILTLLQFWLLSGCFYQTKVWNKPNASMDEFYRVRYQCLQESKQEGFDINLKYNQMFGNYQASASNGSRTDTTLFVACMRAQGWNMVSRDSVKSSNVNKTTNTASPSTANSAKDTAPVRSPLEANDSAENLMSEEQAISACLANGFKKDTYPFKQCVSSFTE